MRYSPPIPAQKSEPKPSKAREGEEEAARFIANLGYKILNRNFRYGRLGEIDIVAEDQGTLVFIEVKARTNHTYGPPEASVDVRKQNQLKRIAEFYYSVNNILEQPCRFDVVAIDK